LTDKQIYDESTSGYRYYGEKCPNCGATAKLTPYGGYSRYMVSDESKEIITHNIKPNRFMCQSCNTTHALLPDILTAHSPYSLRFKLLALSAYYERKTTVVKICEGFGIAVSTIYEWKKRLLSQKELFLGLLISCKEPALSFIDGLLVSSHLSDHLRDFFNKYASSFMQRLSKPTTQTNPP